MQTATIYLFVIAIVMLLIELATVSLTSIWFAIGAFAACIVSFFTDNILILGGVFIGVSVLVLLLFRPSLARKFTAERKKTNTDSLIGATAKVTERIDNNSFTGTAVLNGQEWTARSKYDSVIIEAGTEVEVDSISGVKLIVIKKQGKAN